MLVNIHHDSPREHARLFVFGVVFMVVIAMLIALSIAIYAKVFEPATMITLKAERAGLQLPVHGDVRRHGVLVGAVRAVEQDGREASITVALRPEATETIDAGTNAKIIPTTLFGQKYIDLVDPDQPAGRPIADGDVVPSSRVTTNVELSAVLADLFPLLRSINPADLNTTLHALATALQGRGDEIGELVDDLDGYVGRFNERLPTFRENLVLLARVAKDYELATPELVRLMRNATVSARTLAEKEEQLETFMGDLTGTAGIATRILRENGDGLIRLGNLTVPIVRLLDTYSPEYPCLLRGLDRYTGRLSEIFAGGRVAQLMELDAPQRPAYGAKDRPVYGEVGHGPWCLGLPHPQVPIPPTSLDDGTDSETLSGPPQQRSSFNPTSGYAGTPAEQRMINTLMMGTSGGSASSYGSMGSLLLGPQLRGSEVSVG
jgi:phospholipid/cholesterol/gamma-HCH transport system substrate-binding protein